MSTTYVLRFSLGCVTTTVCADLRSELYMSSILFLRTFPAEQSVQNLFNLFIISV